MCHWERDSHPFVVLLLLLLLMLNLSRILVLLILVLLMLIVRMLRRVGGVVGLLGCGMHSDGLLKIKKSSTSCRRRLTKILTK